jgi:hypothetical protein
VVDSWHSRTVMVISYRYAKAHGGESNTNIQKIKEKQRGVRIYFPGKISESYLPSLRLGRVEGKSYMLLPGSQKLILPSGSGTRKLVMSCIRI